MEKARNEREPMTSGTMVTSESGGHEFRLRKIKNQFVNELKAENIDKPKEI